MKSINSDEYHSFLECLISARKNADLTQQELADRLNKPQSFVSKYENRERRLDVIEFLQIVRAIGVSPSEVLRKMEINNPFKKI
ncbi:transcriptional regulator, XRE family [Nitrosomonas ureae]|uniref:Transcriptional regulator, XRE family n=1 Tax=Nitrosomonas ureae TaxID=44577 RepID=A0A285BV86_9PROT|nr:helix-turn-helix transcriptional regulator [Nitrosomonas ureae]SNX59197.1 transcriptional regulator, XRE family [Nitrosomonas ureae]